MNRADRRRLMKQDPALADLMNIVSCDKAGWRRIVDIHWKTAYTCEASRFAASRHIVKLGRAAGVGGMTPDE